MAEALNDVSSTDTTQRWPSSTPGDFIVHNFKFDDGTTLPRLRLHYQTLGTLRTSPDGKTNAVLIMHGTGGASTQFFNEHFAGELFNPGQPLDAQKFFLILRDGIGHGKSSKPSDEEDGNGHEFPHYGYEDMVRADHRLLTEHLGVSHIRLVMGTSMGGMQSWLWGVRYPDFMDALMPLASLPVQIAGRNRMWRKMAMDALFGDFQSGGTKGLTTALDILTLMSSSPLQYQQDAPTRDAADAFLAERLRAGLATTNARDLYYALGASADYDPRPELHRIKVPLVAVNTADDQINPPELGILEREVREGLANCAWKKAVVLPISPDTRGHGSHTWAILWRGRLEELLAVSSKQQSADLHPGLGLHIELSTGT